MSAIVLEAVRLPNGVTVALEFHESDKDQSPFVVRYDGGDGLAFNSIREAIEEYEYQKGTFDRMVKTLAYDIRETAAITPTVLARKLLKMGYRK